MRAGWLMVLVMNVFCSSLFAFDGGDGSQANPYQISTAEHLISIGSNPDLLDKHYIMVADVNMADYVFDAAVIGHDEKRSYYSKNLAFEGMFDGNGHTISNLSIIIPEDKDQYNHDDEQYNIGLFGRINEEGRIENLTLINANINCEVSRCIGILAGTNAGTVYNCHTSGAVNGEDSVGGSKTSDAWLEIM